MMTRRREWNALAIWVVCGLGGAASLPGQEWGDISGDFLFGGTPPTPSPVSVTKDQEVCGAHKLVDESLVVNPGNKGIANVFIYLSVDRGEKAPKVHPSYQADADAELRLDNLDCRFQPRAMGIRAGQTLVVGNKDTVGHNTNVASTKNGLFNPMVPAGSDLKKKFTKGERNPVPISCNIHPWMKAHLLIKEDPYFAVSNEDGHFEIKNLPVGKWTFQVWQEREGYVDEVERGGKSEKWKKGKVTVDVKSGANDLGKITIPASFFK